MCLGFPLYIGRSRSETLILNGLRLSWKFCRKNNLHDFRSIKSNSRSIEPADLHSKSCRTLNFNFTYKHTLSKFKTKCFDHGLPTIQIRVLIHQFLSTQNLTDLNLIGLAFFNFIMALVKVKSISFLLCTNLFI